MKIKKITALLTSAVLLMGTTAFAISDTELAEFEKKQADANMKAVTEVKTKDGEDLTAIIKHDKIIPIYYFENNGFDQFSDYKTSEFYKEFEQKPIGYYVATTDGQFIDIDRYYEPERSVGTIDDTPPELYKNIMLDDEYLSKLLSDEGVSEITDMRFGFFMDYGSNLIFYINTDKGEFVIFGRNTTRFYFDDVLEAGVLYTADEVVNWRKRVLIEAKAEDDYKQTLINDEPYWTVDENGDDIYVTPKPKETMTPDETPRPTATPKATVKPTDAPKETVAPKPSEKPSETDKPKTLSVRGGDKIALAVGEKAVNFPDAQPFIDENDRTQIPIRAVAEMLDCTVDWDKETETVIITREDGRAATLTIGSDVMIVNNTETNIPVQMDAAAIIKDERTYIPVRFVAEAMGLKVEWEN